MAPEPARKRSAVRVVTGLAAIAAGFLLVVLGASLQGVVPAVLAGVLGFATMIAGGYFATAPTSGTRNDASTPAADNADSAGPQKAGKERRFFKDGFGDIALWSLFWWA
jgi:hypothetical protein